MELVQASDALRLTGLSDNQLREWCGRRGIFQPAVPARGKGRLALYSWHDMVALRILREIFTGFGGRASSWAGGINTLRRELDGQFFPALWGKAAIFPDCRSATIAPVTNGPHSAAVLIVPLDPHLKVLIGPTAPKDMQSQLPLVSSIGTPS